MNVGSIFSLTALLYEVRQLSWRPAQVNQRASLKRFKKIRPGLYNQDTSMAGQYGARVDIRRTSSSLSNNIWRWPHLQTHRKETLPTRSEEEQTVVKNCRLNSKRTQLFKIVVVFIQ
jgi:hypothetical protein